ncbi:MAG TPA: hypothetical protein VGB63_18130, partial [Pedobacter sp.]
TMVGLENVDNTTDANKPISIATQTALDLKSSTADLALKAPLASPTFTGTVSGITSAMMGLGNADNTTDANKPVSTAAQTALNLKSNIASPTFTGTVVLPSTTSVGSVTSTELGYVSGVTSSIQTQLNAKGAGTVTAVTGTTNRISSSGGTAPAIDIASTYVGQTSLTTLGTITTGTWNADVISAAKGGAGAISGLLKANGSGTVSAATAGTDYLAPNGSAASLTAFPTLNQSTTGNAATATLASTVTTNANLTGDITSSGNATTYGNVVPAAKGGAGAVSGVLKANGSGTVSAAVAGTDYVVPSGNITGNAATATLASTVTTNANLTGNVTSSGNVTTIASLPAISGANLTSLTASNLSSGTVPVARLGSSGTADATTFLRGDDTWAAVGGGLSAGSTSGQVYLTGASGAVPTTPVTVSGDINITSAGVTAVANNATAGNNIVTAINTGSGSINAARLQNTVTTQGNTFNGASQLVQMTTATKYPALDGSLITNVNANVREVADEFTATAAQTSFTLTQTKSTNSKVKMFVNGIRISNTAYSVTGTTLTYIPANNGSYALTSGDRIQFDYYY